MYSFLFRLFLGLTIGGLSIKMLPAQHDFSEYFRESKALPRSDADRTYSLLYTDSMGYYVLRFDKYKRHGELSHYDKNLQHKHTHELTDKPRRYVGIISIEKHLYLLYFHYIKNEIENVYERVSLYAKRIDPENFTISADSITLIEPFRMESNYYRGHFAVSPDKSKILVYDYEEAGDVEGVPGLTNVVTVRVFNTELQELWRRTVDLSPAEKGDLRSVAIKKLRVNNQGEVAILTDIFRKERDYSLKYVTADPTLFFVGKEAENFARFTPNLGEYFFNQADFTFDQEGNVLWFGFYSGERYYQQRGVFFLKINAERNKVLVKKRIDLDEELLRLMVKRPRSPSFPEPRHFKLVHWQRNAAGGITLSAEHQPPGQVLFHANDVIALSLDGEGNLLWRTHLYKTATQGKKMEPFLSHYMFTDQDKTYILYNQGIYSDGFSRMYQIDSTGKMRRRVVLMYDSHIELVCPGLCAPLGEGKLFVCMQDRFFGSSRVGVLDVRKLFEKKAE